MEKKKLNLGCGLKILKGYVNVDRTGKNGANIICNLDKFPYPFKDNEYDEILMDNVLEHLEDVIKVMEELHRISKPKGIIRIIVPHYSGNMAFSHLTHKHFFGTGSFNNFGTSWDDGDTKAKFKVLEKRLIWFNSRDWFFIKPLKKFIDSIININPFMSEKFLCYPFGGFDHIYFKLETIKS